MREFSIIVAMDETRGIGRQGSIPWHLPEDLKHFKNVTTTVEDPSKINAVLMGRKTWDSLPEKSRPLPGRLNIVLTRQQDFAPPEGVLPFAGLDQALLYLGKQPRVEHIFVIGGGQVYAQAIQHPACNRIFITHVQGAFACDAFFPPIPVCFKPSAAPQGSSCRFIKYVK